MNLNDLSMKEIIRIKMALAIARDSAQQIAAADDIGMKSDTAKFYREESLAYQRILSKLCE